MQSIEISYIYKLLNETVRNSLIEFLDVSIPYKGIKGWEKYIINALSSFQKSREFLQPTLQSLDLAELLSVMNYNWKLLSKTYSFSLKDKNTLALMRSCRNDSAHFKGTSEEDKQYQLAIILDFLKLIKAKESIIEEIEGLLYISNTKKETDSFYFVNTGSYQDEAFTFSINMARQLFVNREFLSPEELVDLALCYEFGIGTTVNINEAYSILSSSSIGRGLYQAGRFLLSHRNYILDADKRAFQFYRKAAIEGYAKAFSAVTYCYHQEIGTKYDYSEMLRFAKMGEEKNDVASCRYLGLFAQQDDNNVLAIKYYKKCYEFGDAMSGYNLALLYNNYGNVTEAKKTIETVLPILEKYSDHGDLVSSYALGLLFSKCNFWIVDLRKSFKYFSRAARLDYKPAYIKTAECFWRGEGTAVDIQEAIKWYRKGVAENDEESCLKLGQILLEGNRESEVEPDYIEAEQCFDRIIDNDPESAYLNKGILHLKMHFCDYPGYHAEQAFSFFQKGFEAGSPLCSYYLGLCYLFEIGTEIDNKKAKELFNKAYSDNPFNANIAYPIVIIQTDMERSDILLHGLAGYSNDVLAKYILGEKLLKSTLDTDEEKGLALMQEAAEQGLSIAENYLGEYFEKSDQEKSLRFYEEAANNGFASSSFNLGRVFEEGKIVKKDKVKAKEYYTSASQNSCKAADYKLKGIKTEEEINEEFERYKSKLREITILGGLFFQYFSDTNFMKFMDEEAIEKESTNIASICSSLSLE